MWWKWSGGATGWVGKVLNGTNGSSITLPAVLPDGTGMATNTFFVQFSAVRPNDGTYWFNFTDAGIPTQFRIKAFVTGNAGDVIKTGIYSGNAQSANPTLYIPDYMAIGDSVTVTGISDKGVTPPTMTVSGGDWTNGETVKNSVARYPSITPTSDEVVGFSEATTGSLISAASPRNTAEIQTIPSPGTSGLISFRTPEGNQYGGEISFIDGADLTYTCVATYLAETRLTGPKLDNAQPDDVNLVFEQASWKARTSIGSSSETKIMVREPGAYIILSYTNPQNQPIEIYTTSSLQGGQSGAEILVGENPSSLTLASSDGLANFSDGMNVTQSGSGYTPVTSAIAEVDDTTYPDLGAAANWSNADAGSGEYLFSEIEGLSTSTYVYNNTNSNNIVWTAPTGGKLKGTSEKVYLAWNSRYTAANQYAGTICRITTQFGTVDVTCVPDSVTEALWRWWL